MATQNEIDLAVSTVQQAVNAAARVVPVVTGLRVLSSESSLGGALVTLTWFGVEDKSFDVSHYNVLVRRLLNDNERPQVLTSVNHAPATVRLTGSAEGIVVLQVQTVLKDGTSSDLDTCPSKAVSIPAPQLTEDDFVTGLLNSSYQPQTISTQTSSIHATPGLSNTTTWTFTEAGVLRYMRFEVTSTGTPSGAGTDNAQFQLQYYIDGTGPTTVNLWERQPGVTAGAFQSTLKLMASHGTGVGDTTNDFVNILQYLAYKTSLQIVFTAGHVTGGGVSNWSVLPQATLSFERAVKVA